MWSDNRRSESSGNVLEPTIVDWYPVSMHFSVPWDSRFSNAEARFLAVAFSAPSRSASKASAATRHLSPLFCSFQWMQKDLA